jgi:undecaprenyl-phosphate 4-deoxy-4-formamido-L-arabinose transferase
MKGCVSVVIPVFNEEANLDELIDRCVLAGDQLGRDYEILLVDDGSSDSSREHIALKAKEHLGKVKGVFLNRNYGQHSAVICGLHQARGAIVVTLDADLQNPPEEIPRLVAKADEGYDVVGTVRMDRQDSLFRRLSSHLINVMVKRATGVMMHDYGCMLRAYSSRVVRAILECPERSTFVPVLGNSFARRTTEIEVRHHERKAGASKYGLMKLFHLMFDLMTSMTTAPLRMLTLLGGLISLAGCGFGLLLLVLRLLKGPGWAVDGVFTLFAIAFLFLGAQFVALGLLGEYIGRIHIDVRGRPRFFVDRTVGETRLPSPEPGGDLQPAGEPEGHWSWSRQS